MNKTSALTGKDLINVGIYTAMYIAIFFVFGLLTALPVIYPFLLFFLPLVCGIPMMLYYTKIKKFGMLTITGIICGIFFFLIGYTWLSIIFWAVGGLAADIVLKFGEYTKFSFTMLSYAMFCCIGEMGCHGILFLGGQSYWDNIRSSMGDQYADTLLIMMPHWMFYAGFAILFVGGICGSLLGHKMLKKHFQRAGIA